MLNFLLFAFSPCLISPLVAVALHAVVLALLLVLAAAMVVLQVHGLWRCPRMLPSMILLSPVSHFVLKGADLMLPGVCRPLTIAAARAAGVDSIKCGDLWAIRVAGNALPFAVGRAVTRVPSLELLGDKGRVLELIHYLGDSLW